MAPKKQGRRVAIVDGLRTPFAKSGSVFRGESTLDLASSVVAELVARTGIDATTVDQVVYGAVVADVSAPNIAREIVLAGPFPESVDAFSVSRACATSTQSFVDGAQSILLGDADIVIVGNPLNGVPKCGECCSVECIAALWPVETNRRDRIVFNGFSLPHAFGHRQGSYRHSRRGLESQERSHGSQRYQQLVCRRKRKNPGGRFLGTEAV